MSATVVRQPGGALSVTPLPLTAARVAAAPLTMCCGGSTARPTDCPARRHRHGCIRYGPNSVRTHRVSAIAVLGRQLRSAVLGCWRPPPWCRSSSATRTQAIIIGVILAASIGLGFVNEYRAERATAALHSGVHHTRRGAPRRALQQGRCHRPGARRRDPAGARRSGACRRAADRRQRTGMQREHPVRRVDRRRRSRRNR